MFVALGCYIPSLRRLSPPTHDTGMQDEKQRKQKNKELDLAISAVEREFGKGSIMRLKEGESLVRDVPVIPTGSLALDIGMGVGGYPRGRIIEIYGPESSGKTTLTLHAIAN